MCLYFATLSVWLFYQKNFSLLNFINYTWNFSRLWGGFSSKVKCNVSHVINFSSNSKPDVQHVSGKRRYGNRTKQSNTEISKYESLLSFFLFSFAFALHFFYTCFSFQMLYNNVLQKQVITCAIMNLKTSHTHTLITSASLAFECIWIRCIALNMLETQWQNSNFLCQFNHFSHSIYLCVEFVSFFLFFFAKIETEKNI